MPLRDYQVNAIEKIRELYGQGLQKVLLHMATGAGKTAVFCELLRLAHAKGTPSLVVVRGRKLISQASERLRREGVPHGIIMSGNDADHHELIRVCSIDTLNARKLMPAAKLIIIDECHQAGSAGYKWFLGNYHEARILGVSATPHLKAGLRHLADGCVAPITAKELTERGFLVPLRYFAPEKPDLSDVKVQKGEYNERELNDVMQKAAITGDIVGHYGRIAANRPALMFAVTVAHSRLLVERFLAEGIAADHIDASSPDHVRIEAINRLERGEIKVLSNVGIMGTGVDIPSLGAVIMARPTKSYNLWIQMIGRGTRPFEGKPDCIILDHAGNALEHGFLTTHRDAELDGWGAANKKTPTTVKDCPQCFAVNTVLASRCVECGHEFTTANKDRKTDEQEGHLGEITDDSKAKRITDWEKDIPSLYRRAVEKGLKPGWIWNMIKAKHGEQAAKKSWRTIKGLPPWEIRAKPTPDSSTPSDSSLGLDQMSAFGKTTQD